ncbi:MAG: hypothetical protein R6U65_02990 [Perlabentimonas sp.]
MHDAKTIINLIGEMYIEKNPNFFYSEVIYFPAIKNKKNILPYLNLSDIFIDQIDTKLVQEQSADSPNDYNANFFFKS